MTAKYILRELLKNEAEKGEDLDELISAYQTAENKEIWIPADKRHAWNLIHARRILNIDQTTLLETEG